VILARLAFRNLLRHRARTLATILGVGLGIAAVLSTLSVGANVDANVRATLRAAAGPADLILTPGATGRAVFVHAPLQEVVAADAAVAWVVPLLNVRSEPLRGATASGAGSLLPGVDSGFQLGGRPLEEPLTLPARLSAGAWPRAGEREVAIAGDFARSRGLLLGDVVTFAAAGGPAEFTLVGLLDDGYALGSTNGGRVGLTHLTDLQEVQGLAERASHLEIALRDGADVEQVRARLQAAVGEGFTLTFPAGAGDAVSGIVQTLQAGLLVLAATLMALGGFMAYNTFMAGVVERTREFALLRTIALRRGDVLRLALWEALWVGAAGVVVGIALGALLAWGITAVNAAVVGFEVRTLTLPWDRVLLAAAIGVGVAFVAALLPAASAARTSPLSALRAVDAPVTPRRMLAGWLLIAAGTATTQLPWSGPAALFGAGLAMATFFAGVALAAPGVIPPVARLARAPLAAAFGTAGRLGANFAARNAARNGVAVGTVLVGAGLIVGVGAMVGGINRAVADWLDTTIVGDLFVTSPARFPADFEARAAAVPGIDQVSGVGLRAVRFEPAGARQARTVALILVDPDRFDPERGFGSFQFIAGEGDAVSGHAALARGGALLAANTIRDRFGLGVGDVARLRSDEGFRDFPIAGVVVDYTQGGEAFVASIADLPLFGGGSPDLYVVTVLPGEDPAAVRERLQQAFPDLLLDATLNAAYRAQVEALIGRTFSTTNSLLALAALISALGVANTLGMNLSRRAHEIAVLRTVGLRRRGVQTMVIAEGMIVVTLGALLGIGFGLLLADVVTAGAAALTGYPIRAVTPWRLLAWSGLFIPLLGLIASWLPARRASHLPPRVAIGASENP
jgi:putative ABC transport system permease protein